MAIKAGTGAPWLADHLHDWGIPFRVIPGWETRGQPGLRPRCVVCHHIGIGGTADAPGLSVVTHGRAGLRNSLANDHLARSGIVTVIAAGVCWHAGQGAWAGFRGNEEALGIEAEGTTGQPLTAQQRAIYPQLVACRLDGIRRFHSHAATFGHACQHREWAPGRKNDTWGIQDPVAFRLQVQHLLEHRNVQEDDMERRYEVVDVPAVWNGRQSVAVPGYQFDKTAAVTIKANDGGPPVMATVQPWDYAGALMLTFVGLNGQPVPPGKVGVLISYQA